ncbi:MAG: metalloregulator ArsR/SmtB family transcription factor [candidate division WOR-3 bacterium]
MQESSLQRTAEIFTALGNEHRLRIVELLRDGGRCVCQIAPEFDLDLSVVSRHLSVLEQAGIIISRREGRWIHYRLADRRVLKLLSLFAGTVPGMVPQGPRRAC